MIDQIDHDNDDASDDYFETMICNENDCYGDIFGNNYCSSIIMFLMSIFVGENCYFKMTRLIMILTIMMSVIMILITMICNENDCNDNIFGNN